MNASGSQILPSMKVICKSQQRVNCIFYLQNQLWFTDATACLHINKNRILHIPVETLASHVTNCCCTLFLRIQNNSNMCIYAFSSSVVLSCGSKESISKLWLDDGIFGSFEATEQSHNNDLTYIIFSTSRGTFCNGL